MIASLGTFAFLVPYSLAGTAVDAAMKPGVYPVVKRVQFGFTVENTLGKVLKKAKFWTYAPVRQTATQKVTKITASQPYQLSTDELGNQILLFEFEDLPAYAAKEISIRVEIDMAEKPNPWPEKNLGLFLQDEQYIESGNFRVASLANTLTEASISGTAKNVFNWVATNIHSVEYIPDDRGALYALDKRTGDCTEFTYLFTALSRASGIPARAMGGYVMAESGVLKAAEYHNWAEFYVDGTWRLADAQKRVFSTDSSRYVAMRIISKNVPNALGNSHRFSFAGEGLKITMH
jgi:transglutaminase-like putative cysteine protease